jgi:hypothetical protein
MRLNYLHLEGLSRDQGGQTSSGLPFRRWRKVSSQGCSPLRPDPDRCASSAVLRYLAARGPLSFPVDRIDRPGDALHSVAFLLVASLLRRFCAAFLSLLSSLPFSSFSAAPVPRFRRAFAMCRADSREFPGFNRLADTTAALRRAALARGFRRARLSCSTPVGRPAGDRSKALGNAEGTRKGTRKGTPHEESPRSKCLGAYATKKARLWAH